jgi:hypothetical protein
LIAVKGRDLDRNHVWNFQKPFPEALGQQPSPSRGLEIESHQWNFLRNRPAMAYQPVVIRQLQSSERKQTRMKSGDISITSFGESLRGLSTNPSDAHRLPSAGGIASCHRFSRQLENRFK